jgi:hypothetical protein
VVASTCSSRSCVLYHQCDSACCTTHVCLQQRLDYFLHTICPACFISRWASDRLHWLNIVLGNCWFCVCAQPVSLAADAAVASCDKNHVHCLNRSSATGLASAAMLSHLTHHTLSASAACLVCSAHLQHYAYGGSSRAGAFLPSHAASPAASWLHNSVWLAMASSRLVLCIDNGPATQSAPATACAMWHVVLRAGDSIQSSLQACAPECMPACSLQNGLQSIAAL